MIMCDSKLLARLKETSDMYIDPLVDIITDFDAGRVALDSEVKDKLVKAKKSKELERYDDYLLSILINELQGFGGHSALNIMRKLFDSPLVSYDEIVTDVHKKLNGHNSKNKSQGQKEKEIALALFGEDWLVLPFKERYERSTSTKVLLGQFKITEALSISNVGIMTALAAPASAALFVGTRLLGTAITAGLLANNSLSQAYRITVPFVAQMGWIHLLDSSN